MLSLKLVLTGLALSVCWLCANAAPVSRSDMAGLSLADAIERTLKRSPDLVAYSKAIEVSRAREKQATLGTNPTLSATAEDFLGTGDTSGIDSMQSTLTLNFVLDRQLLEQKGQQAAASTAVAATRLDLKAVDAAAETARRFISVLGIEAELRERKVTLELSRQDLDIGREGVQAGRRHSADLHRATAEVARAELAVEDGEHELRVGRHLLAASWGSSQPDFTALDGRLDLLPEPLAWTDVESAFARSPLNEKYLTEERLAQSTLALERANTHRPVEYQVGVRHLKSSDDVALVAGVVIPLNWRNGNQGNISAAELQLDVIAAEQQSSRIELRARLFELYENLEHSLHQARVLKQEILPSLEQAFTETRAAYQQGRYSYQELQGVQRELLATRQSLIATSVQAHLRLIEIERLTGTAISKEHPR